MRIDKLHVENFKSFDSIDVNLRNLNIIIGANSSGKSNFVHIFEFLRDISNNGLDNAISMQSDVAFVRNINSKNNKPLYMEITGNDDSMMLIKNKKGKDLEVKCESYRYRFKIRFKGNSYEVIEDQLNLTLGFCNTVLTKGKKLENPKDYIGTGELCLTVKNGEVIPHKKIPKNINFDLNELIPLRILSARKLKKNQLLLETPYFFMPFLFGGFREIAIYDFDPKLAKKAIPISGKTELESDGSNLAVILKKILSDNERRRKLNNLLSDTLPFIDCVDTDKFSDKSIIVKIKEIFSREDYLPASLISDGTIQVTALLCALYFVNRAIIIIEEPERNLHPHLIGKVMELLKERSKKVQLIITTHNPELLRNSDFSDILMVKRNKKGCSEIYRPLEKEEVKKFLKSDIGIEELYVQNLL